MAEIRYEVRRAALRVDVKAYIGGYEITGTATRKDEQSDEWLVVVGERRCTVIIPRGENETGYEYTTRVAEYVKTTILYVVLDALS